VSAATQPTGGGASLALVCAIGVVAFIGYGGCKDIVLFACRVLKRAKLLVRLPTPLWTEAPVAGGSPAETRFFHLLVHNAGRSIARDCQVRLMAAERKLSSGVEKLLSAGPTSLHWAHRPLDCQRLDLLPDEDAELDLFTQDPRAADRIVPFRVSSHPDGIRSWYEPGEYTWQLRLTSANAKTQDCFLSIKHPGPWDTPPTVVLQQKSERACQASSAG